MEIAEVELVVGSIAVESAYQWAVLVHQILAVTFCGHSVHPFVASIAQFSCPCDISSRLLALNTPSRVGAVAALLGAKGGSRNVRMSVLGVLLGLGEAAAAHAPALASVLRQEEPALCSQAIRILRRLGTAAALHVTPLLREEEARFDAIDVLTGLGEAAVPHIRPLLEDKDKDLKVVASKLLRRIEARGRTHMSEPCTAPVRFAQPRVKSYFREVKQKERQDADSCLLGSIKVAVESIQRQKALKRMCPPWASHSHDWHVSTSNPSSAQDHAVEQTLRHKDLRAQNRGLRALQGPKEPDEPPPLHLLQGSKRPAEAREAWQKQRHRWPKRHKASWYQRESL